MSREARVYDSVLDMLPDVDNPTPLVRLRNVVPHQKTRIYAKLEWFNPTGAIKDRVAANLVRTAEAEGRLQPGQRLVEATSGNTGMGLAMLAAAKGYRLTTPLSTKVPLEKRAALAFAGTEVIEVVDDLCPAPGQPEGAMVRAKQLGDRPGAILLDQYHNPANPDAHFRTTGPEIWRQTGAEVTHFYASLGTCGTITGTGRFLKENNAAVQVVGVHPEEGHDIPGVRSRRQLELTDFFLPEEYDGVEEVGTEEAWAMAVRLGREEGLMAGPSSGMALVGALRHLPDREGLVAVVIFADSIFKYTSSLARHQVGPQPATATPADEGQAILGELVDIHARSPDHVDLGEVDDLLDRGAVLLDVRTAAEFADERAEGSVNGPLDDLIEGNVRLPLDYDTPIVTLCAIGKKSLYATLALKAMGYREVRTVMGGLEAWQGEGRPIEFG